MLKFYNEYPFSLIDGVLLPAPSILILAVMSKFRNSEMSDSEITNEICGLLNTYMYFNRLEIKQKDALIFEKIKETSEREFIDPLLNELINHNGITFLKIRYDKWSDELRKIITESSTERASLLSDLADHISIIKNAI